ncbi:MAG: transglutaminase domain-containing protein, partial [Porphyromonadaceae bacterium]|nr:transglutaminase domain-containing protein [Porphyromonadaceae bacterium]
MNIRILTLALTLSAGALAPSFAQQAKAVKQTSAKSQLQQDFLRKKQAFPRGDLFRIFDSSLFAEERDALTFLYAYMPTNDLIDRDGAYFLENVRSSLQARQEMPWGKQIPEREWRHFVLPIRV